MRRPAKPFVTEYKNPTRRPKDMFDIQASPGLGANAGFNDVGESSRNFPPAEDGYEAAMRAADALFAAPSAARPANPHPDDQGEAQPSPRAPDRAGGRILEAIDATPVDPFAALEAERAPKRRGRKPGSKNKPKLPIAGGHMTGGHMAGAHMAALDEAVAVPMQAVARNSVVNAGQAKTTGAKRSAANLAVPAPQRAVAILAGDRPPPAGRSGERFAWVRTTLRPGERWKRRLPKVAW